MKLKKTLLIIMLASNLSGCLGYWVSSNGTGETVELSENNAAYKCCFYKGTPYYGVESAKNNHPVNGSQIYNVKTEWCGLTIWAIIPIPLKLPVCHSNIEMTFANGEPIRRVEHYVKGSGLLCGPFVLIPTAMEHGTTSFCSTEFH
jgi:hypothetical protein